MSVSTSDMPLCVPPVILSRTPPPGHLLSLLRGEDKDPAESKHLPVSSSLDLKSKCAGTCVLSKMCVCVCKTPQQHRRCRELFPVKSRSPHNKGPWC